MIERSLTDDTGVKLKNAIKVIFYLQIGFWIIAGSALTLAINWIGLVIMAIGILVAYLTYIQSRAIADICYNSHAQVLYLQHIDLCIAKIAKQDPIFVRDVSTPNDSILPPDIPNVSTNPTQESS